MATADYARRQMRQVFDRAILAHPRLSQLPEYVRYNISRDLETSCHNSAVRECIDWHIECTYGSPAFISRYSSLCDRYARNLDVTSSLESDELGNMLATDAFLPSRITELSSRDINPLSTQSDYEEIRIRSEQKTEKKFTKRYKCHACGANRATYEEVQRSAIDEASHNRICCLECGNVWLKTGV